ncbi:HSCB C-terminal oligomerization domain-containing protein, partial [Vararia minispora EC-137]
CPSCGQPLPVRLPACRKCLYIQRVPDDSDFYDIFDQLSSPNPFRVDPSKLKLRFRDIQRHVHPDVWSPYGEQKVEAARDLSGLVNKAYNTLLSPVSRIEYILSRHGLDVAETDQVDDPELLMEILEAREGLQDASSQQQVDNIRQENAERVKDVVEELEQLVDTQDWERARQAAVRLKYLQGIEDAAKAW